MQEHGGRYFFRSPNEIKQTDWSNRLKTCSIAMPMALKLARRKNMQIMIRAIHRL